MSLYVKTYIDLHDNNIWNLGLEFVCQNNKENIDFTETKGAFSLSVIFERPF